MLAYLDALLAAHTARDTGAVERLLADPLAHLLTREALAEAQAAVNGASRAVPLRLLQLRHQTAQLLADRTTEPAAIARRRVVPASTVPGQPTRHPLGEPLPV